MEYVNKFDTILAKLRLTSDVKQVHICLEELSNNFLSQTNTANLEAYCSKLPEELASLFQELFLQQTIDASTQIEYKNKIDTLIKKLYTCKIVQLTLAFQPDNNTITYFSDWLKKNVGSTVVIDLQCNPNIVGGAQLIYDGMYKDYSIRKDLASAYQLHKEDIMNLLK